MRGSLAYLESSSTESETMMSSPARRYPADSEEEVQHSDSVGADWLNREGFSWISVSIRPVDGSSSTRYTQQHDRRQHCVLVQGMTGCYGVKRVRGMSLTRMVGSAIHRRTCSGSTVRCFGFIGASTFTSSFFASASR